MLTSRPFTTTLDRMLSLNRAFDQAFSTSWTDGRVWVPAVDLIEETDAYVMYADLPGVDPSQIDVTLEHNVLTIRGTKPSTVQATSEGEIRVYAAERAAGSFERSIRLPELLDGDHIAAEFSHGLLKVRVPKAKAARARKIEVKSPAHANISHARPAEISEN